jgi:hypothetical protein
MCPLGRGAGHWDKNARNDELRDNITQMRREWDHEAPARLPF